MSTEKVKVAVRVRPFSPREINSNAELVVSMDGQTTILVNPNGKNAEPHKFTFDHSYWSHDGFKEDKNGYNQSETSKYADQRKVFNDLGKGMLSSAWEGYNCSIFAYGQTGSGKSYSIMGYGANKGIVPQLCEGLFEEIARNKRGDVEYQVTFSMLEIYNENVRDLLSKKDGTRLKIRENKERGFYAEGLKVNPVGTFEDVLVNLHEGERNRTLAATKMNEHSSRAHTIVTLQFAQKYVKENMTKYSSINLVDLAGSERAAQTGATGDRFEESKNINKSLMVLGTVIKGLCDKAAGKKGTILPFRDSKLTMLLQNALGGNSKTIMIAAISPAAENYDQTLSTLRYADRAKSIVTKAKVNESETDKLIKDLIAEKERLLKELSEAKTGTNKGAKWINTAELALLKEEKEREIARHKEEIANMNKTWEIRLQEARAEMEKSKADDIKESKQKGSISHLWNLNEDPSLCGKIMHFIKEEDGEIKVGSSKADPPANVILNGPSIHKNHAVIYSRKGIVYLQPDKGKVLVNGTELTQEQKLRHQDRILFGSTSLFVYCNPKKEQQMTQNGQKLITVTYEFAQAEIAKHLLPEMEEEDLVIKQKVLEILPLVQDANGIAFAMNKHAEFTLILVPGIARGIEGAQTEIFVKVKNLNNNCTFFWNREKFLNRQCYMDELYQDYEDTGRATPPDVSKEQDPFWEPPDTETLIGTAPVPLESLAYMLGYDEVVTLISYESVKAGFLKVSLAPCDINGEETEDFDIEDPVDLVGQNMVFKVKIDQATHLPKNFTNVWCKYKLAHHDVKTSTMKGPNPKFQHEQLFRFSKSETSHEFINYLHSQETNLLIEVWGTQDDQRPNSAGSIRPRTSLGGEDRQRLLAELNTWREKSEKYEECLKQILHIAEKKADSTEMQKIVKLATRATKS